MKTLSCKKNGLTGIALAMSLLGCIDSFGQNTSPWPSTGSVGIGTVTPTHTLHVVGKTRFDINTTGLNGGRSYHTRPSSTNYENLISFGSNGTSTYEWIIGTPNNSTDFVINGNTTTTPLRVLTSNGNIGLSLNVSYTPLTKVQIGGNTLFSPTSVQPDETIWSSAYIKSNSIPSAPANPDYTWYQNENTGFFHPATNVIGFCSAGAEKMRIHSNGYVGIGTNNPVTPLHVNGAATFSSLSGTGVRSVVVDATGKLVAGTLTSASTVNWALGGNSISNPNTEFIGTTSNSDLVFKTNSNSNSNAKMVITASGNVGINVPAPTRPFEIKDQTGAIFAFAGNGWGDMVSTTSIRPHYAEDKDFSIYQGTPGASTLCLTIDHGNTHIGTQRQVGTHSDAKLSVYGKMVATSCYVTQSDWADFVFAKDYQLPKLSDIESYYKSNGHLPLIPSEKEVKENGIDLGEMNKLLLQKVEELTILMVEQEKRIKQLEKKSN